VSEGMLIALIPSVLTFAGVLVTVFSSNKKLTNDIKLENNKVVNDIKLEITAYHSSTDEKIKELTREVREHNNFAKRMPVVESEIKNINEKVNHFHNI
jgi:16S rRNA C1402 N4-methylase RsmH